MRKIIATSKAPAAIGPYSQANVYGNLVFTSGQIPLNPETAMVVEGGIEEQTRQVFANLQAVLEAADSGLDKTLKTTVFLKNMGDFQIVNQIYAEYFQGEFPSRSAVEVARLPKDVLIEIEAVAHL